MTTTSEKIAAARCVTCGSRLTIREHDKRFSLACATDPTHKATPAQASA